MSIFRRWIILVVSVHSSHWFTVRVLYNDLFQKVQVILSHCFLQLSKSYQPWQMIYHIRFQSRKMKRLFETKYAKLQAHFVLQSPAGTYARVAFIQHVCFLFSLALTLLHVAYKLEILLPLPFPGPSQGPFFTCCRPIFYAKDFYGHCK